MINSIYLHKIEQRLSKARFAHVCGVSRTAVRMAARFGADQQEAEVAGLLHDYAREIPAAELVRIAEEHHLIRDEIEYQVPVLLHGPVGAALIRDELGIDNPSILEAVRLHTLGDRGMKPLSKIIYIADLVEPGRKLFTGLEELRQAAEDNLDWALLLAFDESLRYCLQKFKLIHPQTIAAWNFLVLSREE